jgi:hypothetical protein
MPVIEREESVEIPQWKEITINGITHQVIEGWPRDPRFPFSGSLDQIGQNIEEDKSRPQQQRTSKTEATDPRR